ncbi:MAG: hypothetical protein LUI60_01035 [Clostridia bacterium]|nr:hypothetical protein [Clostridia bacterium]
MDKITLIQLKELLCSGGKYAATNVGILYGGKEYRAEKLTDIIFTVSDGKEPDFSEKLLGYAIYCGDEKLHEYPSAEEFLCCAGGLSQSGMLEVTNIDGFDSLEKFRESIDFNSISMNGLLQKYADCDEFSLTCACYGADGKKLHVDSAEAEKAYKKLQENQYELCLSQFMYESEEDKKQLPDFGTLYADIMAEVEALYKRRRKRPLFPCDMYTEGKMKYKQDISALWHIYSAAGFLQECREDLAERVGIADSGFNPMDSGLYAPLKPYVTRTEVTYCWHCTTSGSLSRVFYIQLNGQTKNWLLQFKDDYALEYLDDLAFYKDGKLQFSSCTHEGFHTDF